MENSIFYLNDAEMSQAIAQYLADEKGFEMSQGILSFEKDSEGLYKITVMEFPKALAELH